MRTACDERSVWPASHAPLRHEEEEERKRKRGEEDRDVRGVSKRKTAEHSSNNKCYWSVILDITFLTGDDLFMKLVAAVVQLVGLPVPQKHFAAAHLHTQQHKA